MDAGWPWSNAVAAFEERRRELAIPGAALVIASAEGPLLIATFGSMDQAGRARVTPQTPFPIGSVTKTFTATLAAAASGPRGPGWNDPVGEHLAAGLSPPQRALTLRTLLSHQGGYARMGLLWAAGAPRAQVLADAAGAAPYAAPGERFLYNNVLYTAAGQALADRAQADSWEALLEEALLGPLGMTRTTASLAQAREALGLVEGYDPGGARAPLRDMANIAPAAGLISTAEDLGRWLTFLLRRGEGLLDPRRLEYTWEPQVEVGEGVFYGLGWFLRGTSLGALAEHGGNLDGYSAQIGLLPRQDLGFAMLASVSHTPLQQELASLVTEATLGEPLPRPPRPRPPRPDGAAPADAPSIEALSAAVYRAYGLAPGLSPPPLRLEGRIDYPHQGVSGRFSLAADGRERQRERVDLGRFGVLEAVINREGAWRCASFSPCAREDETAWAQSLLWSPLGLLTPWATLDEARVVGAGEVDGVPTWRVWLAAEGAALLAEVEQDSGRPRRLRGALKASGGAGELYTELALDGWAHHQGIWLPERIALEDAASGRRALVVEAVVLDPPFERGLFAAPEGAAP